MQPIGIVPWHIDGNMTASNMSSSVVELNCINSTFHLCEASRLPIRLNRDLPIFPTWFSIWQARSLLLFLAIRYSPLLPFEPNLLSPRFSFLAVASGVCRLLCFDLMPILLAFFCHPFAHREKGAFRVEVVEHHHRSLVLTTPRLCSKNILR